MSLVVLLASVEYKASLKQGLGTRKALGYLNREERRLVWLNQRRKEMEFVDREASSTSASVMSGDGAHDLESNSKSRSVSYAAEPQLPGVPAARLEALFRRFAQQPEPSSRPTPITAQPTDNGAPAPLETSADMPISPNDLANMAVDGAASDQDDVRFVEKKILFFISHFPSQHDLRMVPFSPKDNVY